MHAHAVLMLAATALVGLFVVIVVAVTLLQRRGALGDPARQVEFRSYGPILGAACSGGAAAVHVVVVGEHAALAAAQPSVDAFALLCSIGAATTHFDVAEPVLAGYLPLGVLSLGLIGAQGALAFPVAWRSRRLLLLGLGVTVAALLTAVLARVLAPTNLGGVQLAYSDSLAIVFDVALVLVIGLLAFGRPRRLASRLRVSVMDAWVGTALVVGAVTVFTVAGYFLARAPH